MSAVLEVASDDFENWLGCQQHRADDIGDLARQLARGTVCAGNLPIALRPVMSHARIEHLRAGPILVGSELVAKVAEIRQAVRLSFTGPERGQGEPGASEHRAPRIACLHR